MNELEKEIESLKELLSEKIGQQNEVLVLGADDLFVRMEIWDIEDKILELQNKLMEEK